MAKYEKFSVVIEAPQQIEVGSLVKFDSKMIVVTGLTKVEYISNRVVLVSGRGTV